MSTNYLDPDLSQLLHAGDIEDIAILIDLMTDSGKGRISMSREVRDKLVAAKSNSCVSPAARDTIISELQRFGGNSLANLLRGGKGVSYRQIVTDVAEHLKAADKLPKEIGQIESAILLQVVTKSLDRMSDDEKVNFFGQFGVAFDRAKASAAEASLRQQVVQGGFAGYLLSLVAANAISRALVGRGVVLGASAAGVRGIGVFTGPIGWALTAIWTAYDLASPAYRVTVPCVVQIAYMRQKALQPDQGG